MPCWHVCSSGWNLLLFFFSIVLVLTVFNTILVTLVMSKNSISYFMDLKHDIKMWTMRLIIYKSNSILGAHWKSFLQWKHTKVQDASLYLTCLSCLAWRQKSVGRDFWLEGTSWQTEILFLFFLKAKPLKGLTFSFYSQQKSLLKQRRCDSSVPGSLGSYGQSAEVTPGVHTQRCETHLKSRWVRAGWSDVSTVSWWSDIFTTLISGNGSVRCCGNFFHENPEGRRLLWHKHYDVNRLSVRAEEKDWPGQQEVTSLGLQGKRARRHLPHSPGHPYMTVKKDIDAPEGQRHHFELLAKHFQFYCFTACCWLTACTCHPGELTPLFTNFLGGTQQPLTLPYQDILFHDRHEWHTSL